MFSLQLQHRVHNLVGHHAIPIMILILRGDPHHVVAPDQNLTKHALRFPVDNLFGPVQLQVHVRIGAHQIAVIFGISPFQAHDNGFANEILEEGFWVGRSKLFTSQWFGFLLLGRGAGRSYACHGENG